MVPRCCRWKGNLTTLQGIRYGGGGGVCRGLLRLRIHRLHRPESEEVSSHGDDQGEGSRVSVKFQARNMESRVDLKVVRELQTIGDRADSF